MIKAVRGTRDLLPPETALWNFVESAVRDVFRAYNFQEIRTPIFEATELFARGVGEETDIVAKEMYTWYDGGENPALLFERAWRSRYEQEYDRLLLGNQVEPRLGVDFVGYKGAGITLIEVKFSAGDRIRQAANQLLLARENWYAVYPTSERPRLVLAVPTAQLQRAAAVMPPEIEVQAVDMPSEYEPRQSLTLRPENTAGVVRAYVEHDLWQRGLNKLYYIGPQFRRERPQKGRFRQFFQIGAEVIGPPSSGSERPMRDAEVLELLDTLLRRLGITDFTLQLNSVGDATDRAAYNQALRTALDPLVPMMCTDCQRRAVANPLRVFDCKVPSDQPIIAALPRITEYLGDDSKEHFRNVTALLSAAGVPFEINDRLVRGLDYYTRTAFEFTHGPLRAQNAILGGGRYDGLSEALGGPPAPGMGFAIGEDRLILALQDNDNRVSPVPDVYVAPVGKGMNRVAIKLAKELRAEKLIVELGDRSSKLRKLLEVAAKMHSRYALVVGENEASSNIFALKNLATGEQVSVPRAELPRKIQE